MFESQGIVIILLVGLLAGWLAAKIVQGAGLGIIGDIIVGIIGAFIGRWLFLHFRILNQLHINVGGAFVRDLITATIGAVVLLLLIRIIRRI